MNNQQKVRTQISYSEGEIKWGSDINETALAMINTKLELDVQSNRYDELELTLHVLEGTKNLLFENIRDTNANPKYAAKPPEEIVTDYITKICESTRKVIDVDQLARTKTPVDLVITVPVVRIKSQHARCVEADLGNG